MASTIHTVDIYYLPEGQEQWVLHCAADIVILPDGTAKVLGDVSPYPEGAAFAVDFRDGEGIIGPLEHIV